MYYFLGINDLLFTPFYLLLAISLIVIVSKRINPPILRTYFIYGGLTKILFAILFGMVYEFYYNGGDTSAYYFHGKIVGEAFWESPIAWLKLIAAQPSDYDTYSYINRIPWYTAPSSYFPSRIVGFIAPFCMGTYSVIAIFFSLIIFSGQWAMFTTFYKLYPTLHRQLAISVFFAPSILFWGAGIMKDGIALGALGWLLYGTYNLLIQKEKPLKNLLIILISSWVILKVKIYILISFAPVVLIWIFLANISKMKNKAAKAFLTPFLIILAVFSGLLSMALITEDDDRYSLDKLGGTAQMTSSYLLAVTKESGGSFYDIGTFDLSVGSIIKIIPQGINVTLFRPYLWETRNAFMLISALESLFTLLFTLFIFYKRGTSTCIGYIKSHPFMIFTLTFSLIFAFAVGISTSNFGTLVRYKLPLLPFYWSFLFILYNETNVKIKKSHLP